MREALICTVGTSLFEANLKNLSETTPDKPDNWQEIKQAYLDKNWSKLAKLYQSVDPRSRICGAEINTIHEAKRTKGFDIRKIAFLVSDTDAGKNTGEFLVAYFEYSKEFDLKILEYKITAQLQDSNPSDFKVHGLRNLVRNAGYYINRFGGPENVAFDATGGYKAQIAIAVIIGQALNIPVFYKHERFPEIIDFPPLPIAFDYHILAENADILADFERGEMYSQEELGSLDERIRVLLTEISVDGQPCYELGPIGQIYLTGFRLRYPRSVNLVDATKREVPSFRDDHYPKNFKEFVNRVWNETNWITTMNSLPYDKQKSIKGIGFKVEMYSNDVNSKKTKEEPRLIGTFQDKNNFGARFWIHTTDESLLALTWAADQLNQKYREK